MNIQEEGVQRTVSTHQPEAKSVKSITSSSREVKKSFNKKGLFASDLVLYGSALRSRNKKIKNRRLIS